MANFPKVEFIRAVIKLKKLKDNENLRLRFTSFTKCRKTKCNVLVVYTVGSISAALSEGGLISRTAAGNRAYVHSDSKEMSQKAWCPGKIVVLPIKSIAFFDVLLCRHRHRHKSLKQTPFVLNFLENFFHSLFALLFEIKCAPLRPQC